MSRFTTQLKQLTLRGLDPSLAAEIRRLAKEEGISLNQATLRILKEGAGLLEGKAPGKRVIGDSLDHLIGTWSKEEASRFLRSIQDF